MQAAPNMAITILMRLAKVLKHVTIAVPQNQAPLGIWPATICGGKVDAPLQIPRAVTENTSFTT